VIRAGNNRDNQPTKEHERTHRATFRGSERKRHIGSPYDREKRLFQST
jgi:hypothetical protein